MAYYVFIQDEKINGKGQCKQLTEGVLNIEVTEEIYNAYVTNPDKYIWDGSDVVENPNYDEELAELRKQEFNKEFFLTSLGYIRRSVNMATGDTKDFLSDLLPTISMAVQGGQQVPIITYKEPDFTKEFTLEYMESLQEVKNVTLDFITECALQVSKDFLPTPLIVE